jgi:hypothetical protein
MMGVERMYYIGMSSERVANLTIYKWVLKLMEKIVVGSDIIKMSKKRALYNEIKATQIACYLLDLNGGSMEYYKCLKLIYSIERESIRRWLRPAIYDNLCSMPHGQVVSQTLDRSKYRTRPAKTTWSKYLSTTKDESISDETKNKTLRIIQKCSTDRLSKAEIELIRAIYKANKNKSVDEIIAEHHNPVIFPEWKKTDKTSIPTKYSELLSILGKNQEELDEFNADLDELDILRELVS